MTEPPPDDARQARAPRQVEEDHRVGTPESRFERAQAHGVEDPGVAGDRLPVNGLPVCSLRALAGPAEKVPVDDGEAESRSEVAGEGRLPGTATADDRDAAHGSGRRGGRVVVTRQTARDDL